MIKEQINEFANRHQLTARETEVLSHLVESANKFRELGALLQLSSNTINNHLKKIFKKTSTHSKSELISLFLMYALKERIQKVELIKKPRVFIVDDEPELCDLLEEALKSRGMDVSACSNSELALRKIEDFYPDIVISDVRMPGLDGVAILKALRKKSSFYPIVLFMSGHSDYLVEELLDYGGVDLVHKPLDIDLLYEKTLAHIVGFSKEKDLQSNKVDKVDDIGSSQDFLRLDSVVTGFGGIFASFDENLSINKKINIGHKVRIKFNLPEDKKSSIEAAGEVVWKRESDQNGLVAGVGIRFIGLKDDDHDLIKIYAKDKNILSYVPIGKQVTSSGL